MINGGNNNGAGLMMTLGPSMASGGFHFHQQHHHQHQQMTHQQNQNTTLLNISYSSQQQYVEAINMLDCKQINSSLSPNNIHHESTFLGGIWDQDSLPQQQQNNNSRQNHPSSSSPSKMGDMIDMIDSNIANNSGQGGQGGGQPQDGPPTSSPSTTIHHQNRSLEVDCHFRGSHHPSSHQYLSPLPPLVGGDPYSLEGFNPNPPPSDNNSVGGGGSFHKLADSSSSFNPGGDNSYEQFIPDYNHHNHHNHPNNNNSLISSVLIHQHNNGQCSPGCICQAGGPFNNNNSHHQLDFGLASLCHSVLPLGGQHNISQLENKWDDLTYDPTDYMFLPQGDSPTTSDSISYTDSELDSKSSVEGLSVFSELHQISPPKRKVGRPPKKDKKLKRNEKKTGRLWEFIRDLLKNPEYCPSLVRWENPEEGHFRFVNSEKVAQLWGQIKGNPRMTYEKLSRAMRYYYKSHVFEPVLGRRLVYKFGYNATNWKPVNPNFVSSIQKIYSN